MSVPRQPYKVISGKGYTGKSGFQKDATKSSRVTSQIMLLVVLLPADLPVTAIEGHDRSYRGEAEQRFSVRYELSC